MDRCVSYASCWSVLFCRFYAPALKKLKGHIAFGLSVHASVSPCVRPSVTSLR